MMSKNLIYDDAIERIRALTTKESDWISIMATVACELHHSFDYFDWTGFYRMINPTTLKIGPYQGTHGCLSIDISRGVCGAAARSGKSQLINDVTQIDNHIACSPLTRSEIVVPIVKNNLVIAVLDVDSNQLSAFDHIDKERLEELCSYLASLV